MKKIFEEYGEAIVGMIEVVLCIGLIGLIFLGESGILNKVLLYFQQNLFG